MSTTFNTADIIKQYGDYYENSGQNLNRLKSALMQPSVTLEKCTTPMKTEDTIFKLANPVFTKLIQPFKKSFDPKGGVTFHPNEIRLRQIKVDTDLYPNDIEASWLGFLAGKDKNLKDWPIVRWMMEVYILNQVQEDKELYAVYKGVYDENGTSPEDTMDGLRVQLINGAKNEKYPIHVIRGIGALNKSTILDQIEAYDDQISDLYTGKPVIHFMSQKWVKFLKRDKRSKGYYFINSPQEIDDTIDFTAHVVCGLPSMAGTNDLFSTFKENVLHLTKRGFSGASLDVQLHDRQVHILGDWWEGIGFACNQLVWTTAETVEQEDSTTTSGGNVIDTDLNVMTNAITDITHNAAVANGELNGLASLAEATLKFYYGTSKAAMTSNAAATLENGILTGSLTGLSAATKYYVKAVVTIGNDSYAGKTVEFTTAAAPLVDPICVTTPASSITAAGATLNASYADAGSRVTGGGFEYGTDMAGTLTDVTNAPAAGANSKAITGLTAATTYYVRAYVLVGTTKFYGGWSAFATSAGE